MRLIVMKQQVMGRPVGFIITWKRRPPSFSELSYSLVVKGKERWGGGDEGSVSLKLGGSVMPYSFREAHHPSEVKSVVCTVLGPRVMSKTREKERKNEEAQQQIHSGSTFSVPVLYANIVFCPSVASRKT